MKFKELVEKCYSIKSLGMDKGVNFVILILMSL